MSDPGQDPVGSGPEGGDHVEPGVVERKPLLAAGTEFAAGSMGPKVKAACSFVERTGGFAAIGSIADTPALLRGETGTVITRDADRLELADVP